MPNTRSEMNPETRTYYNTLKAKNELTRSDVSIYPSYTHLTLAYRVICRQRYYKAGVKQRKQFLKEIRIQEALQTRALDGVRVHREFCNPVISPPVATEIIQLSRKEKLELENILVKNGHIRRVVDDEVKSLVLELSGTNVATTYITCPIKARASLGIKLPFLVMVIKNMKKYFTFEIQICDDKDMRRRFRVSNFQSTTKVRPFCTTMPIGLSPGWNQIQFNLADFTKRAYGSVYLETIRVQIHANVRIRRIYFSDRLYGDDEMPHEFKLFLPIPGTHRRQDPRKTSKEAARKSSKEVSGARGPSVEFDRIQLIEEELPSTAPPATPVAESPTQAELGHAEPPEEAPEESAAEESPPEAHEEDEAAAPHPPEGEKTHDEGGEATEGEAPPPAEGGETGESGQAAEGGDAPAGGEAAEGDQEEGEQPQATEDLSTIVEEPASTTEPASPDETDDELISPPD